jgi:hypothetical protein
LKTLGESADRKALIRRLQRSEQISRYDDEAQNWDEASVIVHAFTDLEESFRTFLDKLLPALMVEGLTDEELLNRLGDIGDEFRHILYHINDPKFYGYLTSQAG